MYERRTLTWYTFAHPATSKYRSLVGMVVLETTTYRLSGDHSNHLSYIPIYEKPLTLIIQWTFALLTYYLHICSVIEEIRLNQKTVV